MNFLREQAEAFAELFDGNKSAYGVHIPDEDAKEGEKAKGESFLKHENVTIDTYLKHLHGAQSVGISPMKEGNTIRFMAIDVDVYPLNPKKYINIIRRAKLPIIPFCSKSKGLHLFIFFSEDVPANKARVLADQLRQLFGLPVDTEIFPKQSRINGNSVGNWINLPYYKQENTTRVAYRHDGSGMTLQEMLEVCRNSRVTIKDLTDIVNKLPLAQAPPCLQTIFMAGGADKGERNIFLFNCATYLKARFEEEYADHLHNLNKMMVEPMDYQRLDTTVIASHNRKDYTYQCKDPTLKQFCAKEHCTLREFGYKSDGISDVSFEGLKQINSSKPYYIWRVSGVDLIFYSETDILRQEKFRELCFRQLHILPKVVSKTTWFAILKRALETIEVEEVDEMDDLSSDSLWITKVGEFLSRTKAIKPQLMNDGLVWYQEERGRIHFKGTMLLDFLTESNMFRDHSANRHRHLLKKLGARTTTVRLSTTSTMRTWYLDIASMHKKGLLLDVQLNNVDEEEFKPLDFVGEEKF